VLSFDVNCVITLVFIYDTVSGCFVELLYVFQVSFVAVHLLCQYDICNDALVQLSSKATNF